MQAAPDFQVGSTGSLLIALRGFYRELGYRAELAWIRVDGACACGAAACSSDPHFLRAADAERTGVHLVIGAENALAVGDGRILQEILGRAPRIPVLRHGGIGYVFLADAGDLPDLFPVLGPGPRGWIPLPPHCCDNEAGEWCKPPSWLTPLGDSAEVLPRAAEVLGAGLLSRLERFEHLGAQLSELGGDGPIGVDEIVAASVEQLALGTSSQEAIASLAALCIAGVTSLERAYRLLDLNEELLGGSHDLAETLHRAVAGALLGDGEIPGAETRAVLGRALAELAGFAEGDGDDFGPDGEFRLAENALAPEPEEEVEQAGPQPGGGEGEEIDWAEVLGDAAQNLAALPLAVALLGMSGLGPDCDGLAKLALLDMAITTLPAPTEHPVELLSYLWPRVTDLTADLEIHLVVVQLFAAMLWRFQIMAEAGMIPGEPDLAGQLGSGVGAAAISDLIGAPSVVFWLERHVLATATAATLGLRVRKVAEVLALLQGEIAIDASTAHLLSLLGEGLDD